MKPIVQDVTVAEMRKMRENGMTNNDIANAVGVSYATVYKYIGPQPSRGGVYARRIQLDTTTETEEEEHAPVLIVENKVTTLVGQKCTFSIDAKARNVLIIFEDGASTHVAFDDWPSVEEEIAAIGRNLKKQTVTPEMW